MGSIPTPILCLQKSKFVTEEKAISPSSKDLKLLLLGGNKRMPLLGEARGLLRGEVPLGGGGGEGQIIIAGMCLFVALSISLREENVSMYQ